MNRLNALPASFRGTALFVFVLALLAALTAFAYSGVWHFSFINFDDGLYVFNNPQVKCGVTRTSFLWAWSNLWAGAWHPLTWNSLQLDATIFGPFPGGFHAVNLLLHISNSFLLVWLCRRFWSSVWPGALVAALFAVHPQHVESVAWVSERKDLLSTLFGFVALLAYGRYANQPSVTRYLLVTFAYLLSLLAKPMLVTLPCLMLVFDWWPMRRWAAAEQGSEAPKPCSIGRLISEKVPWLFMSAAISTVTLFAQGTGGAVANLDELTPINRLCNAEAGYCFYIEKAFWPAKLSPFYPLPPKQPVAAVLLGSSLLLIATAVIVAVRRRLPEALFGWLWFLGTLVPVIGLIQVGGQAYADRYSYFPLIGLLILFAAFVRALWLTGWGGRTASLLLGLGAVVVCTGLTRGQREYWCDSESLWRHAISVDAENYVAHRQMADLLAEQGRLAEAITHSEEQAAHWPYQISFVHLADLLVRAGRYDEAIEQYENAVRDRPSSPNSHLLLAKLLLERGRPDEAAREFEEALAWRNGWADAYSGLATAQDRMGDREQALQSWAAAVAAEPTNANYHNQLGELRARVGDTDGALKEFETASQIDPGNAEAWNNRGNVLAALEHWPEAALAYREALERDPDNPHYRFHLALALHQRGEIDSSRRQYKIALAREPDWPRQAAEAAWKLATAAEVRDRDGQAALRLARQACEATEPCPPAALDALAAACAELGRFEDAQAAAERALERARSIGDHLLAGEIEGRLGLYRRHESFHDASTSSIKQQN
ncbi:MAG TPA: tetratricopeptide repeat protein [Pirellulales bacterium]|nr:tetratricopeptide repeat protein [Pirellulales bacterium]